MILQGLANGRGLLRQLLFSRLRSSACRFRTSLTSNSAQAAENGSRKLQNQNESDLYKEQITQLQQELQQTQDKYLRALAEVENIRERNVKQVDNAKLFAIQSFCKDIVEVADILEKATESIPLDEVDSTGNQHFKSLYQGLKLTESHLQKVFSAHGLERICPLNEKFDPNFHEALFQVESKSEAHGVVAQVSKVGYTLHGRTLRPALVGVTKVQ